jgi:hypothetical protein
VRSFGEGARKMSDKQLALGMAHAELVAQVLELQKVYDRFFHAVCQKSCKYQESEGKEMMCCDWSILIDDFDNVRKNIFEVTKQINLILYANQE